MDSSPSALFVATDLDRFETESPEVLATDVTISGRCYRRLDPPYYAWLRRQVALAKQALDAGRLAATAFEPLRAAFNAVHAWAVKHLGEAALLAAAKAFDPKTYVPPKADDGDLAGPRCAAPRDPAGPSGHRFPSRGAWPFTEPVSADAVAKVDAVRDQARALGWSDDALYRNRSDLRFPYGGDYGLVCFVGDDVDVAAVARESITLKRPRGNPSRLPNPDVPQPWRRAALAGVA